MVVRSVIEKTGGSLTELTLKETDPEAWADSLGWLLSPEAIVAVTL